MAREHGAREVTFKALLTAMIAQPRKPFVKTAYDLASWVVDHPTKDVVARYRNFLSNAPDLQGFERLDGTGHPVNGNGRYDQGIRPNPNTVPVGAFREAARRMTAEDGIK
jgi:hypothetical protein